MTKKQIEEKKVSSLRVYDGTDRAENALANPTLRIENSCTGSVDLTIIPCSFVFLIRRIAQCILRYALGLPCGSGAFVRYGA